MLHPAWPSTFASFIRPYLGDEMQEHVQESLNRFLFYSKMGRWLLMPKEDMGHVDIYLKNGCAEKVELLSVRDIAQMAVQQGQGFIETLGTDLAYRLANRLVKGKALGEIVSNSFPEGFNRQEFEALVEHFSLQLTLSLENVVPLPECIPRFELLHNQIFELLVFWVENIVIRGEGVPGDGFLFLDTMLEFWRSSPVIGQKCGEPNTHILLVG